MQLLFVVFLVETISIIILIENYYNIYMQNKCQKETFLVVGDSSYLKSMLCKLYSINSFCEV